MIRTRVFHIDHTVHPMNFLRLLPVIFSFLLLAAHFYRSGGLALVTVSLLLPCLLFMRKSWVPRIIQLALLIGAAEWLRTLWFIAQMRIQFDMPWTRLAIILGGVALFTALSGLVFFSKALKARYSGRRLF
jgi:hypothetical protein